MVSGSFELHLFRPEPGIRVAGSLLTILEREDDLAPLDERSIGDFLITLGPAIRFSTQTELGDQYVYEDELGCTMEIMVSRKQVAIGVPNWYHGAQAERAQRVAYAIALAIVARFDLTLYDPQRHRIVRASRKRD